jgi:diaminopimelate epimerase
MKVGFEKWEGLGNDFVVLRDPAVELDDAAVKRLCDRRFGVGADGVLVVETKGREMPRMIVRNADGSRPEMCGNGLRCVAGQLAGSKDSALIVVATDAGEKTCEVRRHVGGDPRTPATGVAGADTVDVVVDMGVARAGADLVAVIGGREHRFLTIDMGNPHAISFADHGDDALHSLGPAVAALPPGGTNVELCRQLPDRIAVAVWERGVGPTLACGTGACAVAAAACDTGRARFGAPITVALPGGLLEITVAPGTRAVRMRGPARRVFSGEVVIA